jgi:hypothetical protein
MTLQWILVALTALLAGAYLARQLWRAWAGSGCGTGSCGCASAPAKPAGLISTADLTARVKGRGSGKA